MEPTQERLHHRYSVTVLAGIFWSYFYHLICIWTLSFDFQLLIWVL